MKHENQKRTRRAVGVSAAFLLLLLLVAPTPAPAQTGPAAQKAQAAQDNMSEKDKQTVAAFDERVKAYVKMREALEAKHLPKLSKDAKPEEIEAHKKAFQELVRNARTSAKHGDVFTPEIAAHIRTVIKTALDSQEKREVRQTVLEAENKAVPIRVNYTYPETEELVEMPPTLLLQLPQLPKQVKFRFVRRSLLLVDRENGLIIDYMTDALP
jgi:ABC-type transporter MlaC component